MLLSSVQAVKDLDRFAAPAGDKVTAMDSEAAVKARNELIEIQSRLEALQKLQSKLNHMDGQVVLSSGAAACPSI